MVEYTVDSTKFIILLLLVAALFLGIGVYAGKATTQSRIQVAPVTPQVTLLNSVHDILQNRELTDPKANFKDYRTDLLISHSVTGYVINTTPNNIRLRLNQTVINIPKTPNNVYFLTVNQTQILISSQDIKIGDVVTLRILVNALDYKSIYRILTKNIK